jgi:hypothetical protein
LLPITKPYYKSYDSLQDVVIFIYKVTGYRLQNFIMKVTTQLVALLQSNVLPVTKTYYR